MHFNSPNLDIESFEFLISPNLQNIFLFYFNMVTLFNQNHFLSFKKRTGF